MIFTRARTRPPRDPLLLQPAWEEAPDLDKKILSSDPKAKPEEKTGVAR